MQSNNLYTKISNYFNQSDSEREESREEEINELLADIDIIVDNSDNEFFITYT